MEQNQPENRSAVDKEFQKSLEQLQDILQDSSKKEEETPKPISGSANDTEKAEKEMKIDLAAWEEAVADIEQYFEEKKKPLS
ncbi:MAG: hypothetical protein KME60_14375 [Cyanomargarita calcarea GSE-NOS-MK-12-04C]|jgi:Skp family chaperone for outer membrane proteins|uniref:Uncharacterized protein n=1 Tax=Cyanomargarita calcarea GSE-NOS-MK-12-04C TaxID=2839659 RepID=A0A951QMA4_9CYAN|nr:hypothetical protein [Cyanomargarita calcarea GSE-NOS-MK-12-04C]